jgi:membrane-associated phospholipid phosphatase
VGLIVAAVGLIAIPFAPHTYDPIDLVLCNLPISGFFATAAQFATYGTVLSMLALIWTLDASRRCTIIYLLAAVLLTGNVNEVAKRICGRARPEFSLKMGDAQKRELEQMLVEHPHSAVRICAKDIWLIGSTDRPYFSDKFASFPSGHAAAAFSLAAVLIIAYPRARFVWLILAAACALARVRFHRHFLEDVLVGGVEGWIIGLWVCSWKWPRDVVAWLDRKLKSRGA